MSLHPGPFLAIREIRSLRPSTDYNPFAKRKSKYNKRDKESDEDYNIDNDYDDHDDDDDSDTDDDYYNDNTNNYNNQSYGDQRLMPFGLNIMGNTSKFTSEQLDYISMSMNRKLKKLEDIKLINFYCIKCEESQPRSCNYGSTIQFCSNCGQQLRYQCSNCPQKIYSALASAQRHVHGECINPIRLRCFFCKYQTARKYRLITHIQNKHNCDNQQRLGKKKKIRKSTVKRWKLGRKCKNCKQKFKTSVWYERHMQKCKAGNNTITIKVEDVNEVEEV